jgi:diguanylate cyclase (GGDEF)-like protein
MILPDIDGLEVLRRIKSEHKLKEIPIVILSGISNQETVRSALKLGAIDFIHKPFKIEEFVLKIDRAILSYKQTLELHKVKERLKQELNQEKVLTQTQAKELEHMAYYDYLTNLPNRVFLDNRLKQLISFSKRNNKQFALFFLDLDKFKQINDSLGHKIGDEVLREVATRFKQTIRAEDTVIRYSGDEFIILISDIKGVRDVVVIVQNILKSIEKPMNINGEKLTITTSIGISIYPQDSTKPSKLIQYADIAMYNAKNDKSKNYHFFSKELSEFVKKRMQLESELKEAVRENQFLVYFQPQFDMTTQKLLGSEALVRWNHPRKGILLPEEFLPLAKTNNLIAQIDSIVLKEAIKNYYYWYKQGLDCGVLSINLSIQQLNRDDFIQILQKTLNEFPLDTAFLEFEILEKDIISDPENSIKQLKKIKDLGIEISVDDFGVECSFLRYLKEFPISNIKIDRTFVIDLLENEDDALITKMIIALAKSLNLNVVAEGVENEEEKQFLLDHGCTKAQGFLFSEAIASNEMEKLLKDERQELA